MMFAAWGNPKFNPLDAYLPLVMPGSIFSLLLENGQQDWVQEIGQKIQAAQTTVDREELDRQFQEIERILHEQAAFVFLFQYIDVYGADANLNWQPRSDEIMFMTNASWE